MENLKKLLIRSYDDELTLAEKDALKKGLSVSQELSEEQEAMESLREKFESFAPEFKTGFSDRVLQKLEKEESGFTYSVYSVFKRVALSGVAAIIALLFSIYLTDGSLSLDALYGLYEYVPDEAAVSFFNL